MKKRPKPQSNPKIAGQRPFAGAAEGSGVWDREILRKFSRFFLGPRFGRIAMRLF
jgi:hypothetical protein